jgi:hypothetical protein
LLLAELLLGLEERKIAQSFLDIAKPLKKIKSVVDALHERSIKCIVITVGPKQVANVYKQSKKEVKVMKVLPESRLGKCSVGLTIFFLRECA